MSSDVSGTCAHCGANVYAEHIRRGIACYLAGRLLCSHCMEASPAPAGHDEQEPLRLEEESDPREGSSSGSRIYAFGSTVLGGAAGWNDAKYKRPLNPQAPSATRCRTFHAKLNDSALQFLNDQINEWVDAHAEISIKFATSTIGIVEGKHADPHLLVTVFY